ncbi:MAG: hypothetical protein Q8Q59_07660 [Luteolibacter sp.]|jgi:hypothetical protein|nr:hypothetical protein [Luteolibacter sp.]
MKLKYIIRSASLVVPSLLLCNCATIFGGATKKEVKLSSNPPGAIVRVTDKNGDVIHQGVTPTSIALTRSAGYFTPASYNASFVKKGYPQQNVDLKASVNPWYFGNIVFGGLIGLVIVDPLTGAMWTLDDECTAQMQTGTTAKNDSGSQPVRIVERSKIPKEWESHLVAVR